MPTQEQITQADKELGTLAAKWASAMVKGDQGLADKIEANMDRLLEIVGQEEPK